MTKDEMKAKYANLAYMHDLFTWEMEYGSLKDEGKSDGKTPVVWLLGPPAAPPEEKEAK